MINEIERHFSVIVGEKKITCVQGVSVYCTRSRGRFEDGKALFGVQVTSYAYDRTENALVGFNAIEQRSSAIELAHPTGAVEPLELRRRLTKALFQSVSSEEVNGSGKLECD
jgi:hypothetical protein